jgi:pimeloyl-ACP methyl ester carboxylesterase
MSSPSMTPRPFTIEVPDEVLKDLRERLARVRWPDEVPDSGWRYGTDLAYMKDLVAHWRDRYDWRRHEAELNAFRQFTAPVAGIDLHFIHEPGVGPRPLPLLLSHGWPGSVWEFHKILPLLTDPGRFGGDPADAFTVVAPSLPGYGLSFRPNQPRFGVIEIADAFAALMSDVLSYQRFGAQGGDWGAFVTARLGYAYPKRLVGIHMNLLTLRRNVKPPAHPTEEERRYLEDLGGWLREEAGYQWIQGTKPQTLAYGLTDSPVGQLAWIVEKFKEWTDSSAELPEDAVDRDHMLTNVMLYWLTGTAGSSARLYYENMHGATWGKQPSPTPVGVAVFVEDVAIRRYAEQANNIVHWTEFDRGGHFAAMEAPDLLVGDVRAFFRRLR